MRATWTPTQEQRATEAYKRLLAVSPTHDAPYSRWNLAGDLGLTEQDISTAMHWVYRMISGQTGVYIGSRKGPGGGYYITSDKQEAAAAEVGELKQMWSHSARMVGICQQRVDTGLGNKAQMRRILASEKTSLTWIEEALAEHGVLIGSTDPSSVPAKRVKVTP